MAKLTHFKIHFVQYSFNHLYQFLGKNIKFYLFDRQLQETHQHRVVRLVQQGLKQSNYTIEYNIHILLEKN